MADPGFIPGFIGVGIDLLVHYIIDQINIARRCKKEMNSLRDVVQRIEPIIRQIQQYRQALNWKKEICNEASAVNVVQRYLWKKAELRFPQVQGSIPGSASFLDSNVNSRKPLSVEKKRGISCSVEKKKASAVNEWLTKLEALLRQAFAMAHECRIPARMDLFSRNKTSKKITAVISEINQHLDLTTLMVWASQLEGFGQIKEIIESSASSSSASTSATTSQSMIPSTRFFIKEPLIVGQEIALSRLEKWVTDEAASSPFSRIGVLGKGGSGKTLLLKTLFNHKEVRDFFCDGLFLWLTVSQSPSFTSLLNELSAQIAMHTKENPDKNMSQEAVQIWLKERLQGKRFILILDDVWEKGAELLEELGLLRLTHSSDSTVIVSSRNRGALLGMGVPEKSIIKMGDLDEYDSWRLFSYHAFPYNNRNVPTNIDQGTAKVVCGKCGGLPLAIKAVARAMADIPYAQEWEFAARRLPIANSQGQDTVYQCLRLSYDALGYDVNLQMCFLYLAAFIEDEIIHAHHDVIPLWIGEGLLARKKPEDQCGHDPVSMGKMYLNILADRCLVEPIRRDVDGQVYSFRMHDVLRVLAIQIAEDEENFFCRAGKGLTALEQNDCSGRIRMLLNNNKLSSLPQFSRPEEICSLTVRENNNIEIPKRLIAGMSCLRILDLSNTSLQSLPESVGSLKQLVYLNLTVVPITTLPASITNLVNLQVLVLLRSGITELPSEINKWRSLKYLVLADCQHLKCLPYSISGLTSLQYLSIQKCPSIWTKHPEKQYRAASINDLGRLTQLKSLYLDNNGQTIREGTLGNLAEMEALQLNLSGMARLPRDLTSLLKMRRLALYCPEVVKMESNFCEFHKLSQLKLWCCDMLEQLPLLHTMNCLKRLDIVSCGKLEKLPKEFSEAGAFPSLEIFSLVYLDKLQELSTVEDGAMSALQVFSVMGCKEVKMLPESYLNLKTLKKIRVYDCPMILENLENANTKIKMGTGSAVDIEEFQNRIMDNTVKSFTYDEYWCNEIPVFLLNLFLFT